MFRKTLLFPLTLLILAALACNLPGSATVEPNVDALVQTAVAATLVGGPTATPVPTATTQPLPPAPTPLPPPPEAPRSTTYPDSTYTHDAALERVVNGYAVRFWRGSTGFIDDNIVTISAVGQLTITLEQAININPLTGTDINANGTPDILVETYTGGAHCCSGLYIYEVNPVAAVQVFYGEPGECGYRVEDIDGNGIYELFTCVQSFAYAYCPYAASPLPPAILDWNPVTVRYRPNSPAYPQVYQGIPQAIENARSAAPGEYGEWDNTNKCSVLHPVLMQLMSGQTAAAWATFDELYTFEDKATFRAEIEATLFNDPFYTAP